MDAPQGVYSPRWLADAAHEIMGGIDLDPCSCLVANSVVRAMTFYTVEDDGLLLPWFGNVYLNPPFHETRFWVEKLKQETRVKQALLATTIAVSWHRSLRWAWDNCVILLPNKRIRYWHPARPDCTPRSVVAYWGPHEERFIKVFRERGTVLKRVN